MTTSKTINQNQISLMVEISMVIENNTKEQAVESVAKYIKSQGWVII